MQNVNLSHSSLTQYYDRYEDYDHRTRSPEVVPKYARVVNYHYNKTLAFYSNCQTCVAENNSNVCGVFEGYCRDFDYLELKHKTK